MTDLISRQAAIEAIGEVHPLDYNGQAILTRLKELPTIDPVKHGKWVKREGSDWEWAQEYNCSECRKYRLVVTPKEWEWNYCPNCGAKMDGGEDEQIH